MGLELQAETRHAKLLRWFLTTFRVLGFVGQIKRLVAFCREMSQVRHILPGTAPKAIAGRREPNRVTHPEFFKNSQGLYIYTRQWFPQGSPRGIVFLLHGVAEHSGRYHEVASRLVKEGIAVFALDHQGHGRSEGTRAHVERFSDYVRDTIQYISLVLFEGRFHEYKHDQMVGTTMPKFILGHSMGGLLAVHVAHTISSLTTSTASSVPSVLPASASQYREQWKATEGSWQGLVLSGPALMPDPKTAGPVLIKVGQFLSKVLPKMPIKSLDPKLMSNDPSAVELYLNDPLVYLGGVRARWASELLLAMRDAMRAARLITWPLLILQGKNDKLCHPEGARQFFILSGSKDKKLNDFPAMQHEVFNELGKDKVIGSLSEWLVQHLYAQTPAV